KVNDLIPVLSYLLLRGRCRYCGGKISAQYPLVELAVGILFLLSYLKYGLTLAALRTAVLFAVVTAATVIDWRYRIIPDRLNLAGLLLGVVLIFESREVLTANAIGFLAGGGILYLVALVSRGGMGGGDIKLAAVMGLLLGWQYLLLALFLACAAGAFVGILLVLTKLKSMKEALPFGPYLALGSVIAALAGDRLISWYLQLF
ncbi:MAG: prepilin peptidase, partial [Desulfotomaculaceae bacterium]|nr:prepilin peptidase [Desulfotomaculaceae bacterium]